MAIGPSEAASIVPSTGMGLYVHVPFCSTKCPYCDFNTYQGIENLIPGYLAAATSELNLWGRVLGRPKVNTIFVGGGTPSYLADDQLASLLETATAAFEIQGSAEISVEANPDDLDQDKCRSLLVRGVNRLSVGVQSLDDGLLALLGRRHDSRQAVQAFQDARSAGFTNINLDLMYGLPHQSISQWQTTLGKLISLRPDHLSLYCLTLEDGTPLRRRVEDCQLPRPDEDLAAEMYQFARESLVSAGYRHYEISNWAVPGCESKHNTGYWLNLPYLGVGPGAHSKLGDYRFWDVSSPRLYVDKVRQWQESNPQPMSSISSEGLKTALPVGGHEHIDTATGCAETMFMGLRLLDGLDLSEASARAGRDLESMYQAQISELLKLGLLERHSGCLRLASSAYLIANQVFTRFVS